MKPHKQRYALWKDGVYIRVKILTTAEANNLRNQGYDVYDLEEYGNEY